MLHPARPGEVLGQLAVGDVDDAGLLVDDQGADAGRARIDGDHLGHGGLTLTPCRRGASGAARKPSRTVRDLRGRGRTLVDNGVTTVL